MLSWNLSKVSLLKANYACWKLSLGSLICLKLRSSKNAKQLSSITEKSMGADGNQHNKTQHNHTQHGRSMCEILYWRMLPVSSWNSAKTLSVTTISKTKLCITTPGLKTLSVTTRSIAELCITSPSIKTLGMTTLSIAKLSITTSSMTKLNITLFRINTLSTTKLSLSIKSHKCCNCRYAECCYAECRSALQIRFHTFVICW